MKEVGGKQLNVVFGAGRKNMDLEDAKEARRELEQDLVEWLTQFMECTGLVVDDIQLIYQIQVRGKALIDVQIATSLP